MAPITTKIKLIKDKVVLRENKDDWNVLIQGKVEKCGIQDLSGARDPQRSPWAAGGLTPCHASACRERGGNEGFLQHIPWVGASAGIERPGVNFNWEKLLGSVK